MTPTNEAPSNETLDEWTARVQRDLAGVPSPTTAPEPSASAQEAEPFLRAAYVAGWMQAQANPSGSPSMEHAAEDFESWMSLPHDRGRLRVVVASEPPEEEREWAVVGTDLHTGPYASYDDAAAALPDWIEEQGYVDARLQWRTKAGPWQDVSEEGGSEP